MAERTSKTLSTAPARPKRPTIRDVARLAGVSIATVSNALAGRGNVTPKLVERVSDAVETLGFVKEISASRLRSRQSSVVGVMVPDLTNPIFARLAALFETLARRDGYDLIITSSNLDPSMEGDRLRALVAWRPAGILAVPCESGFEARHVVCSTGLPMVVVDRRPDDPSLDVAEIDNAGSAALAIDHLTALGHRAILLALPARSVSSVLDRVAGARAAAARAGAVVEVIEVGRDVEAARDGILRRLADGPRPDAMFTLNIFMTLGALRAVAALGLRVPEDLSLVGFDDYAWLEALSPPMTAVRQPMAALANHAWEILMARVRDQPAPERPAGLRGELHVRGSTGPRSKADAGSLDLAAQ